MVSVFHLLGGLLSPTDMLACRCPAWCRSLYHRVLCVTCGAPHSVEAWLGRRAVQAWFSAQLQGAAQRAAAAASASASAAAGATAAGAATGRSQITCNARHCPLCTKSMHRASATNYVLAPSTHACLVDVQSGLCTRIGKGHVLQPVPLHHFDASPALATALPVLHAALCLRHLWQAPGVSIYACCLITLLLLPPAMLCHAMLCCAAHCGCVLCAGDKAQQCQGAGSPQQLQDLHQGKAERMGEGEGGWREGDQGPQRSCWCRVWLRRGSSSLATAAARPQYT